ncbi:DNA-binding protein [Streptomyces eurocidicus]|uniref:DNA-binding protein n=1 Tax=Streptomyces eurocidicus TaxID=66423 RepID=A0A2N8NPI5_STREU|nr:helix-turn-helix transcriptional regulator [Streptomyces eurocidicus]MBB5119609.1 transcriptional regulator with XRE-family HTH domain [Streptomyces eurocidicus]MBF6050641.1 helix-turn-helix domain-containing protein [Streptomyces eurocidicus]PNE30670.1 DNA-binding protein [Streptomyces eurocidicus]
MADDPELPAKEFGKEIKCAREAAGWSQQGLAAKLLCGQPYVSKVETGQQLASPQFAEQCDRVFGTPGTYARMRQRAADAGNPVWFIPYLELEREALRICDYSNAFVMGILQTPEYAEAVYRSARPQDSAVAIKKAVEDRMRRRDVLDGPNPPQLWVILHESVLWSGVGGRGAMREQLRHLLAASELPPVTLQVLPFSAEAPSRGVPFIVLTRQDGTDVLYEETYQRGQVDDAAEAVAEARGAYERLRADALAPTDSLTLIRYAMEAHTHEHHPRLPPRRVAEVQLQPGKRRQLRRMGPRIRALRRRPRPGQ